MNKEGMRVASTFSNTRKGYEKGTGFDPQHLQRLRCSWQIFYIDERVRKMSENYSNMFRFYTLVIGEMVSRRTVNPLFLVRV